VTNTWVVSDAAFANQHAKGSSSTTMPNFSGITDTANGPTGSHLSTLLTRAGIGKFLANAPAPTLTEHKSPGAPVAGRLVYALADGSLVHASQQQLKFALLYSVVGLDGGGQLTQRPTGSVLITHQTDVSNQVILITSSGRYTQIAASGVPANNIAPPLTIDQLPSHSRPRSTASYRTGSGYRP
jgi:hypothetical protein